jgi:branched-subunit amino acid transport protein
MTTFAVLAAGGAITWLLRATLIVFTPSSAVANRLGAALRYAPPAAFATLAVTSLTAAAHDTGHSIWRYAAAAAVTAVTARFTRNLAVPLAAGAAAITVLTII